MPKTFTVMDDALIERVFQPVSDQITDRIRISRTTLACVCIDFATLAWMIARTPELAEAVAGRKAATAFTDLALLLLGLVALVSLRMLFRKTGRGEANPLRQAMRPHRAVVLLMLVSRLLQMHVLELAAAADLVMLLGASAALYLGACTERPWMRRKWAALARI